MADKTCETCGILVAERPFDGTPDDVVMCGECLEELRAKLRVVMEPLGVDVPRYPQRGGRVIRWHPRIVKHPLEGLKE